MTFNVFLIFNPTVIPFLCNDSQSREGQDFLEIQYEVLIVIAFTVIYQFTCLIRRLHDQLISNLIYLSSSYKVLPVKYCKLYITKKVIYTLI